MTDGLNEKSYRNIIEKVINNLPLIEEWYDKQVLNELGFSSWTESLLKIHNLQHSSENLLHPMRLSFQAIAFYRINRRLVALLFFVNHLELELLRLIQNTRQCKRP